MMKIFFLRKAQHALKDARDFAYSIYLRRHQRYSLGFWGIPREQKANVVFKLIEYGPYSQLFDDVAKMEIPDKIEHLKLI